MKTTYLIQINFKSGVSIKHWFEKTNISYKGDTVTHFEWKTYKGKILYIDLSQIESVFQLKHKTVLW